MALNHQRTTTEKHSLVYDCNIHSYLQSCELGRMHYNARSPQIHLRPVLLKTIQDISKRSHLSNVSIHLAVCLLDFFMDNHNLKFDTILLVTFACLTLAAKVEEHCRSVPKLNYLHFIGKKITNLEFRRLEMKILMFFNFNISMPTVAHFIELYKDHFYSDRDFENRLLAPNILKDKFNALILIYQELSLESTKLISFKPSMVAASIVLCTRHSMGLMPCWTPKLRKVTGYLKKELVNCCSLLGRNVMQTSKFNMSLDEGYQSSSPGFQSPFLISTKKRSVEMVDIVSAKRIAF